MQGFPGRSTLRRCVRLVVMPASIFTLLFVPLITPAGAAGTDEVAQSSYQGCWKTAETNSDSANYIEMCIENAALQLAIYYPNGVREPTHCKATGVLAVNEPGKLHINTRPGYCENGRGLAAANLNCTVSGSDELHCLHPDFALIRFFRNLHKGKLIPQLGADAATTDVEG